MPKEQKKIWMKKMKKYAKLDGKHQSIVDDYLSGKTRLQLAKKYCVAEGSIQQVLKKMGVKCRSNKFKKGMKMLPNGKLFAYHLKGKKLSKEHIKKCLRRKMKSSLELKFEKIINQLKLPYKFVGNGEFFVGRKCPDFIHTNGENVAIEVYCRKHKQLFKGNVEGWKEDREQIFNNHNWKLIFFDETQISENTIKSILGGD